MRTGCARTWAVTRSFLRLGLTLAVVCAASPRMAGAANESLAVTLRAGAALEGAQQTLKGGPCLALLADRVTGGAVDFGLGLTFARDPGGGTYSRDRVLVTAIEAHARSPLRNRAQLELGLGYYWIDREPSASESTAGNQNGLGGFIGGGYELWRSGDLGLGLALAYHVIAAEVSSGGGNLEDYYTVAGTFRWGGIAG